MYGTEFVRPVLGLPGVKDSLFVNGNRCDVICTAIKGRIELLRAYVSQKEKRHFVAADCFNDVEKDVAYSGEK